MKHLEDALGHQQIQNNKNHVYHPRQKHRPQPQKWTLDPDLLLESAIEAKQRLTLGISDLLQKQFECQKYLQEETFRDLLHDLGTFFPQCTSELEQLTKIEQAIVGMSQSCPAQLKNYIKHFQSLLDAKIRKLKKRGKRAELVEYDRLLAGGAVPPRRNQVYFINEDDRTVPKRHLRESRQDSSRRSFGTMNSLTGSNQNESGGSGGNNQSGSGSKSGEANALSVLLANIDAKEERKGRQKEKQQETYQFTTILNATLNVRQRNISSRTPPPDPSPAEQEQDKDEAFIFHRPKQHRHKI